MQGASGHDKLVVGIRPEHVSVASAADLTGKVVLVEDLGSDAYITCRLADDAAAVGDQPRAATTRARARSSGRRGPSHLHLFDAGSGERVGD